MQPDMVVVGEAVDGEAAVRSVPNGAEGTMPHGRFRCETEGRSVGHFGRPRSSAAYPRTQREAEVLRLIARGHAIKEIAARLDVGARTVETYKARAMEKLGFTTRADVVRYAVQRGWLNPA